MMCKLEAYDREKLHEARNLVVEVFEYYYGRNGDYQLVNRLATILRKIDFVLEEKEGKE